VVHIVLFVGGVAGYLTDAAWWRTATIVAAIVSLAGIVVFWDGLAMPSVVFALIVDLAILAALVVAHWPAGAEMPASPIAPSAPPAGRHLHAT